MGGYNFQFVFAEDVLSSPLLNFITTQSVMNATLTIIFRAALLTGRYQTRSGIYPKVLSMASVGGELIIDIFGQLVRLWLQHKPATAMI